MGVHDMGPHGQSPIVGGLTTCMFCHAPHSGLHAIRPLWSQKLSTATNYSLYTSGTLVNKPQIPTLGSSSNLCLSCHDGTVAPGQSTPWGKVQMVGSMYGQDVFGTDLTGVHPFNFKLPLQSSTNLIPSLTSSGVTGNPAVKLIGGNVQCASCHEPHAQSIDPVAQNFLVMNNAGSALCLACHISAPNNVTLNAKAPVAKSNETKGASTSAVSKPFVGLQAWTKSVHAQAVYKVSKGLNLGPYGNTKLNGCLSCHAPHNAPGAASILTGPLQPVPNMDSATQNCITCHNGGSNISPATPNVFAELAKTGHPLPQGSNRHTVGEGAVLNKNRHATCVDCHDPHSSQQTTAFLSTPLRASQYGVSGVSATDGTTVVSPAVNQFETCLRCHSTSSGKQVLAAFGYLPTRAVTAGDPLNLVPQFSINSRSSHPVTHDSNSSLPQPSLRKFMWNLDGHTQGRAMSTRILCSDCHNSDDNREFGGPGPNGPHGSKYSHILERRYEFSQVTPGVAPLAGPGTTIQNLLPAVVDAGAGGPYSLCAKCHDLANVLSNASFRQHAVHINGGFSCSVCHTSHGMGAQSATISGERLVNFDLGVVAPNDNARAPVSYNRANSTCTLKCHNYNHDAHGRVTPASVGKALSTGKKS
jgi:predicted CXXCH cytochrome family protein